eukprot:CAMPEP_0197421598 /NCGR_PEP_ID=MMETSP1170-20131217/9878_1 /TAXON_ID=54406 /ORGANISM="Sarcinochrysis sp, Strain CCMP770" /LENGTH=142 /DNA_ID=CAMNT_0042948855 /DNA_START=357 /DNA_END=781 /DNA_ORIENTATION=+
MSRVPVLDDSNKRSPSTKQDATTPWMRAATLRLVGARSGHRSAEAATLETSQLESMSASVYHGASLKMSVVSAAPTHVSCYYRRRQPAVRATSSSIDASARPAIDVPSTRSSTARDKSRIVHHFIALAERSQKLRHRGLDAR